MYSHTLGAFFGSARDESLDPGELPWSAIKVYRDGNPIVLERFETEDEAEDYALAQMNQELADNGQFGVGA